MKKPSSIPNHVWDKRSGVLEHFTLVILKRIQIISLMLASSLAVAKTSQISPVKTKQNKQVKKKCKGMVRTSILLEISVSSQVQSKDKDTSSVDVHL